MGRRVTGVDFTGVIVNFTGEIVNFTGEMGRWERGCVRGGGVYTRAEIQQPGPRDGCTTLRANRVSAHACDVLNQKNPKAHTHSPTQSSAIVGILPSPVAPMLGAGGPEKQAKQRSLSLCPAQPFIVNPLIVGAVAVLARAI